MSSVITVFDIIERYIADMNGTPERRGLRPIHITQMYKYRGLQKDPIAKIEAAKLTKFHIKDFCRRRVASGVCASTVNADIGCLTVALKYAPSEWEDCEDVSDAAITAARPSLIKHNLIGKSTPRKRVPTDEEIDRLLALFVERDKISKIKMAEMLAFALCSTRRISEICRIQWGDIDWEHKDDDGNPAPMYMVRDVKHPTKKIGNHKTFALLAPMPEIILRQPRLTDAPTERVFPFNPKSAGQRYTRAKHELGIENLRFHDNRREATTRWLKLLPPSKVRHITGHETSQILERVYDATKPSSLHAEVARLLAAAAIPAPSAPK